MSHEQEHSPPRKRARTSEERGRAFPPSDAAEPPARRVPGAGIASFLMMSLRGRTDAGRAALAPPPGSLEAAVSAAAADEAMPLAARLGAGPAPVQASASAPVSTPVSVQPPLATEDSATDDEELQQLSMVRLEGEGAASEPLGAVELNYDDVKTVVFSAAKDPRLATLQKSMRMVKAASNGAELMARLVRDEDESGLTLLMVGVKNNLLPFCAFLLEEGADVNHNSEKRTYALLLAAQKGWADMTKFLLQHGANDESKNMSLIPAAHFGHLPIVQLLLACGADLNFANKKGTTPLMRAAQEGKDNVVQFLIDEGVDTCAANVSHLYQLPGEV